jgi:hypothetical protein
MMLPSLKKGCATQYNIEHMATVSEARVRVTLPNPNAAKVQGPITKWEKKWVSLGHLKLYKWVPGMSFVAFLLSICSLII